MHRHHNTISSFTCNLVATVLGIVLTLGTTMWYDRVQANKAADSLVEGCLNNMEDRLRDLEDVVAFYDMHIEWFRMIANNRLDSLTEDELDQVANIYTMQRHILPNLAYEKAFSQSASIHETLGSFSTVIGTGFEYLQSAEANQGCINELKKSFTRSQILSNNTYLVKESMHAVIYDVITDPQFHLFRLEYSQHEQMVRRLADYLKFYIPAARRLWRKEVTEEDFWAEAEAKWNEL